MLVRVKVRLNVSVRASISVRGIRFRVRVRFRVHRYPGWPRAFAGTWLLLSEPGADDLGTTLECECLC